MTKGSFQTFGDYDGPEATVAQNLILTQAGGSFDGKVLVDKGYLTVQAGDWSVKGLHLTGGTVSWRP